MTSYASLPSWLGRLLLGLVVVGPALAQPAAPSQDLSPAQLVAELRGGDRILYLRHAATDFSQNDSRMKSFEDCAGQRNLVDPGRDDARKIGIAIRALGIPIGRVLSSPFCRCVETAELAFGRAEKLNEARYAPSSERWERYADLRALLGAHPGKANTVIVGHGNPFYALTGLRIAEGETAVIRPLDGRFEVIGRVKPDGWAALRASTGR